MSEKELLVRKIENGTVIDHIPANCGLKVASLLNLEKNNSTTVILMNVPSKKLGKKDIVKVENRELTEKEANRIALIAPSATLNIVRNWEVVEKRKIILPEILEGVVKCPNKNCITNYEEVETKFIVETKEPLKLRCYFCERVFTREEVA
ncbi:MAG: aspartate carbamoyltransferase regulatory subunit [Candidatus Aenigmarchaeota archaeon]|nr:aspartate carbamoyltransferase regulatory subunit [Candidatus Aenigmarchaeota archaeon]